ncbi:MAG: VWA domain-containing protein [Planctomycetales bacterium]|nr:VWA domain-containing protein [Planctomycetales bacterium]
MPAATMPAATMSAAAPQSDSPHASGGERRALPAWVLSLATHVVFAILLALVWQTPTIAPREEPDRTGGIVLVEQQGDVEAKYFHEPDQPPVDASESASAASSAESAASAASSAAALPDAADLPPLLAGDAVLPALADLPATTDGLFQSPSLTTGGRPQLPSGTDIAAVLAEDAARLAAGQPAGSPTRVSLFGSPAASGRTFVFLIDRSKSMGGDGLNALAAAEPHLRAALDILQPEHQFQLVAYDQRCHYVNERQLLPATSDNKQAALSFYSQLAAHGKTDHDLALHSVARLRPDVIFLLSDGGDPHLTDAQILAVRRAGGNRTAIHCIQFGFGPLQATSPFLRRLADATGGQFTYVNVRGMK